MKKLFFVAIAGLVFSLVQVCAADAVWLTDFAAAKRQAKAENKVILLDFTGSNWCGVCQKLDREVFSTSDFKDYAKKHLVLVKLDFPRPNNLPPLVTSQNKALQQQFGVKGYPTIVLLDSDAKALWRRVGYGGKGAQDYIAMIDKKVKKD